MQKVVNIEAKANLRSSTMARNSDAHCLKGYRLSHNTSSKVQTQDSSHKDLLCSKKSKNKDPKSAPPRGNAVEPTKKENKKKRL